MRVICIETTVWVNNVRPEEVGTVSVRKGSIYHVTGSVEGKVLRDTEKFQGAADGTWYQLLELTGWHHSFRFLPIPDDEVEEKVEELELVKSK